MVMVSLKQGNLGGENNKYLDAYTHKNYHNPDTETCKH